MNCKINNNTPITNNSNMIKNTTIMEKLKNIKSQLEKYNLSKGYLITNNYNYNSNNYNNTVNIKLMINKNSNNNIIKPCTKIKTNMNSPRDVHKKVQINNKIIHPKNSSINNRSFENRKYIKLKNKTPEISRASSTRYNNRNNIIKYNNLKQVNNINVNNSINKNKKYDIFNIKLKKVDNKSNQAFNVNKKNINTNINNICANKKYEKKKNNYMEVRTNKHLNILEDYLKGIKKPPKKRV